jgi:hypothetical protein
MSTAAVARPGTLGADRSFATSEARRLVVPIGGTGWGWGLLARFTLIFSVVFVLQFFPSNPVTPWLSNFGYRFPQSLAERFPIFPADVANTHLYRHLIPLVLAAIWLLLDRKRKHDVLIHEVGRLLARYGIACMLTAYALEKTFSLQGSGHYLAFSGYHLPYGAQLRQIALFYWLGHSLIYENFAALVEILPLFLVPFRRLQTWSALVALAACFGVFVANTGHWNNDLAMTPVGMAALPVAVLLPHTKRFFQLFTGRVAEPMAVGYLTPPAAYWWIAGPFKVLVVLWTLYTRNQLDASAGHYAYVSTLGGVYEVEQFSRNGKVEPLTAEYPNRWREVSIGRGAGSVAGITVDGELTQYMVMPDPPDPRDKLPEYGVRRWTEKTSGLEGDLRYMGIGTTGLEHGTIHIPSRAEIAKRMKEPYRPDTGTIHYMHPTDDQVTLSGIMKGDTIVARLRRVSMDSWPLLRHRWYPEHWRNAFAQWMREQGVVYPRP